MWQVIYIAPNRHVAEQLRDALSQEGILVSLRATGLATSTGATQVELVVAEGEAQEAHELLNAVLGRSRFKKATERKTEREN